MQIYNYIHFRDFLNDFLKCLPKRGHGVLSQWAKELGVSTTLISQILLNKKLLGLEMAEALTRYLSFSKSETDYFLLLVEFDRAGSKNLKDYFFKKIKELQDSSRHYKNRVQNSAELSENVKAEYYSNWSYAGITNLVACKNISSIEEIASRLKLPRASVLQVVEFLVQNHIIEEKNSGWQVTSQSTYISPISSLTQIHHHNWRTRAVHKMDERKNEDLFYTSPMSLSEDLALKIRGQLVNLIGDLHKQVAPSPSEVVRTLNIDWFEY